jgi:hypothetical protein
MVGNQEGIIPDYSPQTIYSVSTPQVAQLASHENKPKSTLLGLVQWFKW